MRKTLYATLLGPLLTVVLAPIVFLAAGLIAIDNWRYYRIRDNWHYYEKDGVSYRRRYTKDGKWELLPLSEAERRSWRYWGDRSGSL